MCIAWLLGEVLCRYLPCPFGIMCGLALSFYVDLLPGWSIYLWQSPTITVLGSICALRSIRVFWVFFNVDGCPCVGCLYVKNWYFLLMNCSFN
jgi:hypothetical protein